MKSKLQELIDLVVKKGLSKEYLNSCRKLTDDKVIEDRYYFVLACY